MTPQPSINVQSVRKVFNAGTHAEVVAVRDISLSVAPGEIVLIMGPSGSGKTTLLTMLGGLLKPTAGNIILQGKNIDTLSDGARTKLRRTSIGFIFQSFNLLENLNGEENVVVGSFKCSNARQRANELLGKLGVEKRAHAKPKELSGGERQRVAIARALINNPSLILADEPTANLDRSHGHEVMKLLCSIGCEQGKSIVIVSHDERIKDVANRVMTIEDGKLVREEEGAHNNVCRDAGTWNFLRYS